MRGDSLMAKKDTEDRLDALEHAQEEAEKRNYKQDLCIHTARILMGMFWASVTTASGLIYTFWGDINTFFKGFQNELYLE
jgi:hypothetical protein